MGCLARAFGLFILAGWIGGGTWFLGEQKAHGESLVLPLVIVGVGLLIAAGVVGMALQRLVPGWQRPTARGPAVVTVVLAVASIAGIYFVVDARVENRRPGRELTAALAPACRGGTVVGAGAVSTDGTGNHLVVLDAGGDEVDWTGHPAIELRPPSLSDAELVVCVEPEATRTQIQVCEYTNGPAITRYAVSRKVEVHAASTGSVVMAFTVTAEPRACRETEPKELTELVGSLEWGLVEDRLAYLIASGVDPTTVIHLGRPIILGVEPVARVGLLVENVGRSPVSARVDLTYPGEDGSLTIEGLDVEDLAPGEQRVASWSLADLAPESSVATQAAVGLVLVGVANPQRLALARQLSITPPALPLQAIAGVETGVRNASSVKVAAHITIGFMAGTELIAVAEGTLERIPAGGTATASLSLAGDASRADGMVVQVDSAFETD